MPALGDGVFRPVLAAHDLVLVDVEVTDRLGRIAALDVFGALLLRLCCLDALGLGGDRIAHQRFAVVALRLRHQCAEVADLVQTGVPSRNGNFCTLSRFRHRGAVNFRPLACLKIPQNASIRKEPRRGAARLKEHPGAT
jgi:hypothetical protein